MRLALVLALIHGMVPGLGELAEKVVHYVVEAHLAHSEADRGGLADLGSERCCGGSQHLCDCCVSQVFVAQSAAAAPGALASCEKTPVDHWQLVSLHDPAPPRRPPIAS